MELYNRIDWDWFFTGSTSKGTTHEGLERIFGKFRSLVANITKCQVSAMGLVALSGGGNLHCHCMLVGRNRFGKTLADVAPDTIKTLERNWLQMANSTGLILPAIEKKAVRYIVENNLLYKQNVKEITPMNVGLLKKLTRVDKGVTKCQE